MRAGLFLLLASAVLAAVPCTAAAEESASATVTVSARFSTRTALRVSSQLLRFDVTAGSGAVTQVVEFSAGARTHAGGEVVLTVEAPDGLTAPSGAVPPSLTFSAEGGPTGDVRQSPCVAARWVGSGLRTGRVMFTLRSAAPGSYAVPVRFVLSAP